ncbi:hypothetical protein HMPREF3101_05650 [Corynebacterium sp. HMSC29G08]|nr:hypothetical protein HMPREF3101_05650 [Corynebacterium sp. HMSC29G08]
MLKKAFVVLPGAVVSALALSACVPSAKIESLGVGSETGVSSVAEAEGTAQATTKPRGFAFESGFLEFGDFDPYALGDDIFNPCTEITLEEYAAAGFPGIEIVNEGWPISELSFCEIPSTDEQLDRAIVTSFDNGNTNREMIEMQGLMLPHYRSELIPELFAFAATNHDPSLCYTQVDTLRGGFGASAGGLAHNVTQAEMCELSIHIFEQLFLQFGTGNVH